MLNIVRVILFSSQIYEKAKDFPYSTYTVLTLIITAGKTYVRIIDR